MLLGLAVLGSATVGVYVLLFIPTYAMQILGMKAQSTFGATMAVGLAGAVLGPLAGLASDVHGRKPVMIGLALATLVLIVPGFLLLDHFRTATALLAVAFVLAAGHASGGAVAIMAIPEALPPAVRSGANATVYALAIAVFGGTAQFNIAWLVHHTGDNLAPAYYWSAAAIVGLVAMALFPEIRAGDPQAPGQKHEQDRDPGPPRRRGVHRQRAVVLRLRHLLLFLRLYRAHLLSVARSVDQPARVARDLRRRLPDAAHRRVLHRPHGRPHRAQARDAADLHAARHRHHRHVADAVLRRHRRGRAGDRDPVPPAAGLRARRRGGADDRLYGRGRAAASPRALSLDAIRDAGLRDSARRSCRRRARRDAERRAVAGMGLARGAPDRREHRAVRTAAAPQPAGDACTPRPPRQSSSKARPPRADRGLISRLSCSD